MSREDKPSYVRLPAELKRKIAESAAANRRTMSGEIIYQLEMAYGRRDSTPERKITRRLPVEPDP